MTNPNKLSFGQGCALADPPEAMTIHQGDCINLNSDDATTYQVIGVDDEHRRCCPSLAIAIRQWLTGV